MNRRISDMFQTQFPIAQPRASNYIIKSLHPFFMTFEQRNMAYGWTL